MQPPSSLNWCSTQYFHSKSKCFLLSLLPIFILCPRYRLRPSPLYKPSSLAGRCPHSGSPLPPNAPSLPAVAFEGGGGAGGVSIRQHSGFICRQRAFLSDSDFNQLVIMRLRLTPRRLRVLRVRAHAGNESDVSLL